MQDLLAITMLAFAVTYIGWRYLRRRGSGNCCGEAECPAAKEMVDRMKRGTGFENR